MKPVNIILDTDIGPDCDDAGAVAVLHSLAARQEANIVAMMHCTSSKWGAGCLDALNTYYGRPDIPVGALRQSGFLDKTEYETFNKALALEYPNRFRGDIPAPDATILYRQMLADAPDQSIVVVAIGPLTNLADVLSSSPDETSPLSGKQLITDKVKHLVVMGGTFPSGKEWNFEMAPLSAQKIASSWPTPIFYTGFEVGSRLMTGARLLKEAPPRHPVRLAYERFGLADGVRPSWDLTAVLFAVRGVQSGWTLSERGAIEVSADGSNGWKPGDGLHHYLILNRSPSEMESLLEELMIS
ncbi:nucleoside hydrolase [Cohnella fermenti]|uniref:Nucleoside hydrolase n=1 Tax=Cohnella fermenti TaxID=2565925 RepID=A0A4V3WEG0_9BACL|nr:nucleoside hydrolase [Cohnella fermenti]THF76215.1 nucleoside hydrolase [Cohnella fermenti]